MARIKTGSLDRHGNGWRLRWYDRVSKKYKIGTTPEPLSPEDAQEWARGKAAEFAEDSERAAQGLPGPIPMSDLLDRFERAKPGKKTWSDSTARTYGYSVQAFRTYFVDILRDPRADKVRPAHVLDFLAWRKTHAPDGSKATSTPRTCAKDRAVLSAVFTYARKIEARRDNPVELVDQPKGDARTPVILDGPQYEKLLGECDRDAMLRLYTLALGETGGRCQSEVLWLRWEDIDLEGGFLWIASGRDGHRTKSGKGRWVPMTPRLAQALREHVLRFKAAEYDGATSAWVFHHTVARRRAKPGQRIGNLRRAFKAAAKRAKLPAELHQHDLRHRRVTAWLAEGANPVHVKEAVGHADLRTTMGYTHLAREHLRSLVPDAGHMSQAKEKSGAPRR